MPPHDLDHWLPEPIVQVHHRREAAVGADALWRAAAGVTLADTRTLGRLVRLRIPGLGDHISYDEMFHNPPFNVLEQSPTGLISGLVGRIWTLRRDYPVLEDVEAFRAWNVRGTVRVLFASWAEPAPGGSVLVNETRVDAVDRAARLGLTTLRPLIARSHRLIGSEGLEIAARRAEGG